MAHVIEDQDFSRTMGREIIEGMMERDSHGSYYANQE